MGTYEVYVSILNHHIWLTDIGIYYNSCPLIRLVLLNPYQEGQRKQLLWSL